MAELGVPLAGVGCCSGTQLALLSPVAVFGRSGAQVRTRPGKREGGADLMTTQTRGHGSGDDGAEGLGFGGARCSVLYASLSPLATN